MWQKILGKMKVVTIFSGKGGVGKTTMSILFASWLKYYLGERVVAFDFETPESRMLAKRNQDLTLLQMQSSRLKDLVAGNEDFYRIGAIKARRPEGYTDQELEAIANGLEQAKASGPGYIICDFPGRFEKREAIFYLACRGLIDLMCFPIEPEEQSVTSLFVINQILKRPDFFINMPAGHKQEILCFWNKVTRNDSRSKQDIIPKYEQMLNALSTPIPVSPTKINFVDTVKRNSSAAVFVTTTVCYPRANVIKAFPARDGGTKPYIENLFQEIKDRVDSIPDPGTQKKK